MRTFEVSSNVRTPGTVGDEARRMVLFEVFRGDVHAWIDFLLTHGSRRQIEEDLPFAIRIAIRGEV